MKIPRFIGQTRLASGRFFKWAQALHTPKLTNMSYFLYNVFGLDKKLKLRPFHIFLFSFSVLVLASLWQYPATGGQFLPLPGPFQNAKIAERDKAAASDNQPPKISVITDPLKEGKDVLRLRIADESNIDVCIISYTTVGIHKTTDCIHDHDDVYKALVRSSFPIQNLKIHAEDGNGNSSTKYEEIKVLKQSNFFEQIWQKLVTLDDQGRP
jgi:hypothetical protein